MRHLVRFIFLLILYSTQALANETHLVELIVFRQSSENLYSGKVAPDNWALNATHISANMQRTPRLKYLADKLTPEKGYEIILHKAWLQNSPQGSARIALKQGEQHFNHYPIEGTLDFSQGRPHSVLLELWINQFDAHQAIIRSEHFKQGSVLLNEQVTFIDHGNLGALIRIQPQIQ